MQKSINIKKELFELCLKFCKTRTEAIKFQIEEINKALTTETKSSAGDKHETGRAMLQLEREKLGNQLAEAQKLQETLSRIQTDKISKIIGLGSVVCTSQSNYFIGISAGLLKVDNIEFYAISAQTPIGKILLGKQVGSEVKFRNQQFIINTII